MDGAGATMGSEAGERAFEQIWCMRVLARGAPILNSLPTIEIDRGQERQATAKSLSTPRITLAVPFTFLQLQAICKRLANHIGCGAC